MAARDEASRGEDEGGGVEAPTSILVLRVDRLGDAVISTPTLIELRRRFPEARIDLLLGEKNWAIGSLMPAVDAVFSWERNPARLLTTIGRIKRRNYDVVVNLHDKLSSNASIVEIVAEGATVVRPDRTLLQDDPHIVSVTSTILAPFGGNPIHPEDEMRHPLTLRGIDRHKSLHDRLPHIGLNISSSSDARRWPLTHYRALIPLLREHDLDPVLLAHPSDQRMIDDICRDVEVSTIRSRGDLRSYLDDVSRLDLVVTPEGGALHMAAAVGVPVVGLYPEESTISSWRAWGVPQRNLYSDAGRTESIGPMEVLASVVEMTSISTEGRPG